MHSIAPDPSTVEAMERATLDAVPPQALEEWQGWLLPYDNGTVTRARSAVPLRHAAPAAGLRGEVEARYRARGLVPSLRLPRVPAFDGLQAGLEGAGWHAHKPTVVMLASLDDLRAPVQGVEVRLAEAADDAWCDVFLGEGFDPVDGASRTAILRRARQALYASVALDGRIAAVGMGCYSQGLCGVHGMRTLPPWRGRGLATAILAALAHAGRQRGLHRAFLQVEEGNPARALYRRAGFADGWGYAFWAPPA